MSTETAPTNTDNGLTIAGTFFTFRQETRTTKATKKNPTPKSYNVVVPVLDDPAVVGAFVESIVRNADELRAGSGVELTQKILGDHLEKAYEASADEFGNTNDDEFVKMLSSVRQSTQISEKDLLKMYREAAEELEFLGPFTQEHDVAVAEAKLAAEGLTLDEAVRRETAARMKIRQLKLIESQLQEKKAARAAKAAEEQAKEASDPAYKAKRDAERAAAKAKRESKK